MNNLEIRKKAKRNGVPLYMVAAELGIGPNTLSVWLRFELDDEKRERVLAAIDAVVARRTEE